MNPNNISRERFHRAITEARGKCNGDKALLSALAKAGLQLEICKWYFDGVNLKVQSAHSDRMYTVEPNRCDCPARGMCWHRVARRLLVRAAQMDGFESKVERVVRVSPAEAAIAAEEEMALDYDRQAWRDARVQALVDELV